MLLGLEKFDADLAKMIKNYNFGDIGDAALPHKTANPNVLYTYNIF